MCPSGGGARAPSPPCLAPQCAPFDTTRVFSETNLVMQACRWCSSSAGVVASSLGKAARARAIFNNHGSKNSLRNPSSDRLSCSSSPDYQHVHQRRCLRKLSSTADRCRGDDGIGGGPLAGLTVLDCGNFLAGPIVSLHLSAMGADVIKIEKPQNGDDGRAVGPFARDGSSSYHLSTNRGKRSIAIDTRTDAGRKVFLDLAAKADIL
eukprot:COSAG02_NODE_14162_length_1302_cov_7.312552_1_plen_207_part_00